MQGCGQGCHLQSGGLGLQLGSEAAQRQSQDAPGAGRGGLSAVHQGAALVCGEEAVFCLFSPCELSLSKDLRLVFLKLSETRRGE